MHWGFWFLCRTGKFYRVRELENGKFLKSSNFWTKKFQASVNQGAVQRRDSYGTWDFLTDLYDASTYAASSAYNRSF